jgi:hypothetical protein
MGEENTTMCNFRGTSKHFKKQKQKTGTTPGCTRISICAPKNISEKCNGKNNPVRAKD